jgi:hypothetical protein
LEASYSSAVNRSSNLTGTPTRKNARIFALCVLGMVLGMVALAVAAKTLHYSARTAQTRYFSSSVKMANYGHREVRSTRQVAVPIPPVRIEEPEQAFLVYIAPSSPAGTPSKSGPQQLRSPPIVS